MKRVQQNYIKYYFQVVAVFLVAIVCCLLVFFYCIQINVDRNVRSVLTSNVEKQSQHFRSILEDQYDYLEGTAEFLGKSDELLSEENMELLRCIKEKSELERMCIVDADGWGHYDNGEVKEVGFRRYFKEGISGQRTLSDPLESQVDGTTRVVLGVPIFKDNQVMGVLGGSYDVSALNRMLFDDIYEGEGFSMILMKDGSLVSYDNIDGLQQQDASDNFFDYYIKVLGSRESIEKIRDDFGEGKSGYVQITKVTKKYHMVYKPLGYNGWMVCYVVPVSAANRYYHFIRNYEIILSISFVILVLVLFWRILKIGNRRQKELIRYASMDSLTGLYNKKSTEDRIQEWLNEVPGQRFGIQAFLIMDIDYFKDINDQYGHIAGDEVLRQIGNCLRETFRSGDLLGRIGGDEFVVFMKNVNDAMNVEKKAAELLARVRQLNIPELDGKQITCSVGISYSPDHGKGYLELYKHADMALYETKEKGRNGYTIFGTDYNEITQNNYVHKSYTEINPLTGLYYNKAFFRKIDELLRNTENISHMLVAIDIEHFRLFNRLYGRKEGDRLLIDIAECLKKMQEEYHGIAGYINGDNFCILLPQQVDVFQRLQRDVEKVMEEWTQSAAFLPGFGVYEIEDSSIPAVMMYDRATMALSYVYGNYGNRVCTYTPRMETKIEEEIALVSDVQEGLKNEEFIFYVQPQCHISKSGIRIVGGECLVRWQRKEKGIITPGEFIPVLEKTGFVSELDRYLWEKVCQWLREWIDRGQIPIPMSVNVSRIDIFSMDVPKFMKELMTRYQLRPELLKIEIMESVYTEDDGRIRQTVAELREAGFAVMMDDFGTGYSSLNMLKSVSVDVLKLDTRFLRFDKQEEKKGIEILESVVSLSRQMGLPIIVEGVEDEKQEEYLLSLGCRFVQGFYYYKPMPVEQFEQLIADSANLDLDGFTVSQVNNMQIREFLDSNVITDTMLNNMLGPSAFYEVFNNQLEITSVNEQYCRLAGIDCDEAVQDGKRFWNHVVTGEMDVLFEIFQHAYENRKEGASGYIHFRRPDGKILLTWLRVYFLCERGDHQMFYGAIIDVTSMGIQEKTSDLHR